MDPTPLPTSGLTSAPTPGPTLWPTTEPTLADMCGSCVGCAHVTSGVTTCRGPSDTEWVTHATKALCTEHGLGYHWCFTDLELETCPRVSGYNYYTECMANVLSDCAGSRNVYSTNDAKNIKDCTVIGGDLKIASAAGTSVTGVALAYLVNLEKVCGNVHIAQIDAPTLNGLQKLAFVGGSLDISQNSYYGTKDMFLTSLAGLGIKYVGGSIKIAQNYYLEDLGGFGPVTLGGNWAFDLHPGCHSVCENAGIYVSMYLNCAELCNSDSSYKVTKSGVADTTGMYDAECAGNPYTTAPPTPQPTAQPTPQLTAQPTPGPTLQLQPCGDCVSGSGVCQSLNKLCYDVDSLSGKCPHYASPC